MAPQGPARTVPRRENPVHGGAPGPRVPDAREGGRRPPNKLHCWDAATGKERWGRPGFGYGVYSLALSPDGKVLASAGENGRRNERESEIVLWDAASGNKVHAFPAVRGAIDALAFYAGRQDPGVNRPRRGGRPLGRGIRQAAPGAVEHRGRGGFRRGDLARRQNVGHGRNGRRRPNPGRRDRP